MNLNIPNNISVKIEKMDHQGRGIAKYNNKVIFVPNTLVGEQVNVIITKETSNYAEGEIKAILIPSEDRINSPCPYFKYCGGCQLLHTYYDNSLIIKENIIKEIFEKFKLNVKVNKLLYNQSQQYRNKIVLKVNNGVMGLYQSKTHNLIPIKDCLLCNDKINYIIKKLSNLDLTNINEITIRSNNYDNTLVIINGKFNETLNDLRGNISSLILYYQNQYKVVFGESFYTDSIGKYKYNIELDSFFQINSFLTEKLYNKVLEYLEPQKDDNVLDLYCGAGTIGIFVAEYVNKVIGVEINSNSIKSAIENKKLNGIENIEFICGDVATVINKLPKVSSVIVDPPRSGLDNKTIEILKKINSKKIIYISCNPITLARDLSLFKGNYSIIEVTPFDMFPFTKHVECVCVLNCL